TWNVLSRKPYIHKEPTGYWGMFVSKIREKVGATKSAEANNNQDQITREHPNQIVLSHGNLSTFSFWATKDVITEAREDSVRSTREYIKQRQNQAQAFS